MTCLSVCFSGRDAAVYLGAVHVQHLPHRHISSHHLHSVPVLHHRSAAHIHRLHLPLHDLPQGRP